MSEQKEDYVEQFKDNVKGVFMFIVFALVVTGIAIIFNIGGSDDGYTPPRKPTTEEYNKWYQEYLDSDGGNVDPSFEVHQQFGGR